MSLNSRPDTKSGIRQYDGERTSPVFQFITRKYYCQEQGTVGPISGNLAALSFKIENEEWQDLVMKSVRLHIPIKITPKCGKQDISIKLADRFPACCVSLATNAWKCFSNVTMVCNDKVFRTQPNLYQQLLDVCYDTRDELGYGDSHSLKPLAITDFKKQTETHGTYLVHSEDDAAEYIQILDGASNHSDNSSNLVTANGGFLNRVRHMQTEIANQQFCETELVNFIHCGPFMNRVRRTLNGLPMYNDAVPFVKSLQLDFTFDRRQSIFDQDRELSGASSDRPFWPDRSLAMDWLEFATLCNINEPSQIGLPNDNWLTSCKFEITSRPFLSVQYVKMGAVLRDQYKLRAIDYRQEKTSPFSFAFPQILENTKLTAPPVQQRISSRLLEMPSKIYLYCELARDFKKSYFMGGCMRTLKIKNLKLRINNKTNVLFDPTQLELYDHFKRCTRNSWEIGTWEKCPIVVLDPQALGLQEFLAQDSKLLDFEWRFDVEPTAMFCNEIEQLASATSMLTMGYSPNRAHAFSNLILNVGIFKEGASEVGPRGCTVKKYIGYKPNPGATGGLGSTQYLVQQNHRYIAKNNSQIWLQVDIPQLALANPDTRDYAYTVLSRTGPSFWEQQLKGKYFKMANAYASDPDRTNPEVMEIKRIIAEKTVFRGFVWVMCDTSQSPMELVKGTVTWGVNKQYTLTNVGGWYIPESWPMSIYPDDVTIRNNDLTRTPRRLYNNVNDYNWLSDTWTSVNREPNIFRAQVQRWMWDGDLWRGGKRGHVVKVNQLMNDVTGELTRNQTLQTPGARGYPMVVPTGATDFQGISLEGALDGHGYDPQVYQYGHPPSWHTVPTVGAGMGGLMVPPIDLGKNPTYRWLCLQWDPNDTAMGAFSTFLEGTVRPAHAPTNTGLSGRWITAMTAGEEIFQPGNHVPHIGRERHVVQCSVERGVLASQEYAGSFYDYANGGGTNAREGEDFHFENKDDSTQANATSLQFESKVLYEYGQKNYLINRAGRITPHFPGIEKLENKSKPVYGWQKETRIPNTSETRPSKMPRNDYHSQG